jgi:hypothetical protein
MENNTPLLSSDRKAALGCFASFPGSGPAGEICSRCSLLTPEGSRFVCDKYRQLTGRKPKPISPNSSACRYFIARPAFNAPREP